MTGPSFLNWIYNGMIWYPWNNKIYCQHFIKKCSEPWNVKWRSAKLLQFDNNPGFTVRWFQVIQLVGQRKDWKEQNRGKIDKLRCVVRWPRWLQGGIDNFKKIENIEDARWERKVTFENGMLEGVGAEANSAIIVFSTINWCLLIF